MQVRPGMYHFIMWDHLVASTGFVIMIYIIYYSIMVISQLFLFVLFTKKKSFIGVRHAYRPHLQSCHSALRAASGVLQESSIIII